MQKCKDPQKDSRRLSMELYTTFLHKKSPLALNLDSNLQDEVYNDIISNRGSAGLNKAYLFVIELVENDINDLKQQIRHGMNTWKPKVDYQVNLCKTVDEEINEFDEIMYSRFEELLQISQKGKEESSGLSLSPQQAYALTLGLASIYRYFITCSKVSANDLKKAQQVEQPAQDPNGIFNPLLIPKNSQTNSLKKNMFTRSIENINFIGSNSKFSIVRSTGGINYWLKHPTFNSKFKAKSSSSFIGNLRRLSMHALNGHSFNEQQLEVVMECYSCDEFIWGISPQYLQCSYCNIIIHQECKKAIKENCQRDRLNRHSLIEDSATGVSTSLINPNKDQVVIKNAIYHRKDSIGAPTDQPLTTHTSTLCTEGEGTNKINRRGSAGLNQSLLDISTAESEGAGEKGCRRVFSTLIDSDKNKMFESSLDAEGNKPSDVMSELVTTDWSHDEEMSARETFDATVELRARFPEYQIPPKGEKKESHTRMLVLLEFHQKLTFMLRYFKLYEYLLLSQWPIQHNHLAKLYCLDRIPELIVLCRSLINRIERTMTPHGYTKIGEAVYDWLTESNGVNLKNWTKCAQAFVCVNHLTSVKTERENYLKKNPEIIPIVERRHNKFSLVEGISHMRGILFNLPLIANTVVATLSKKTKTYKYEAVIWIKIQEKLKSVPHNINQVCMPLVDMCNNGQIVSGIDYKEISKLQNVRLPFPELINEFPRSLFNHWVIDSQDVITKKMILTQQNKINLDYVRNSGVCMKAILMENALMLIVKDGDKYLLRGLKPTREQGGLQPSNSIYQSVSTGHTPNHQHANSDSLSPMPMSLHEAKGINNHSSNNSSIDYITLATVIDTPIVSRNVSITSPPNELNLELSRPQTTAQLRAQVQQKSQSFLKDYPTPSLTMGTSSKLFPIFPLHNLHTSQTNEDSCHLTMLTMDPPTLLQLKFPDSKIRQNWISMLSHDPDSGKRSPVSELPRMGQSVYSKEKATSTPMSQSDLFNLITTESGNHSSFIHKHITQRSDQVTYMRSTPAEDSSTKIKRSLSTNNCSSPVFYSKKNVEMFSQILETINSLNNVKNQLCQEVSDFVGHSEEEVKPELISEENNKLQLLLAESQVISDALDLMKRTAAKILYERQNNESFDQGSESTDTKDNSTANKRNTESNNISRSSSDRKSIDSLSPDTSKKQDTTQITHRPQDSGVGLTESFLSGPKEFVDADDFTQLIDLDNSVHRMSGYLEKMNEVKEEDLIMMAEELVNQVIDTVMQQFQISVQE